MTALSIFLALLAAFGNAVASVLQRRAAAVERAAATSRRFSWLVDVVRRPLWLWGAATLVLSGIFQAGALASGPLAVVQPVMTTELLFTLLVGAVVFGRSPDGRTGWGFLAMAVGLAGFLLLAAPSGGRSTVPHVRWQLLGMCVLLAVPFLLLLSRRLPSAPRATVLGIATAIGFACTAALMKDAIGRLPQGVSVFLTSWQPYAVVVAGVLSFLLLQVTLGAGTLVASQPALTLGDSLLSTVIGVTLFDERISLGARMVPEAVALVILVAGSVQLTRSPVVSGRDGEVMW